jgi:hypothetical protein
VPRAVLERLELLHLVSTDALRIGDMCYLGLDCGSNELYAFQEEEDPPEDGLSFLWTYMRRQRWFGWQRLEVEHGGPKDMSAAEPFHPDGPSGSEVDREDEGGEAEEGD